MEWIVVSETKNERTERAVTDDGEVLYRSVWIAPSLRLGQPIALCHAMVAARYDPTLKKAATTEESH